MKRSIELTRITVDGDTIWYEIHDNTGIGLLRKKKVEAWIKFHNADAFGFEPDKLPESVLAIPVTLYLLPVTWLYGTDLILPCMDKVLYESLDDIRDAYAKVIGTFKEEWEGLVRVNELIENRLSDARYKDIVFFSGGIDAIHAGMNHSGKSTVLVSIPDVENKSKLEGALREEKFSLIKEFSQTIGSDWLMITNNFNRDVFNDIATIADTNHMPYVRQYASVGKYIPNLCSVAPFAYAMGIKELIMGSGCEQIENKMEWALSGTHPMISNAFKFAGVSFAEQDGLYVRRSIKTKNIISTFKAQGKHVRIWVCFEDTNEQCGKCYKCVRTQLNILCTGENPKDWGFTRFNEKSFSRLVRSYRWFEGIPCWAWDIIDSIDSSRTYPYCNELLHWLKRVGYKRYFNRSRQIRRLMGLSRIFKFSKSPHYVRVVWHRLIGKYKRE